MAPPNAERAVPGVSGNGSQKRDRQDGAISLSNKANPVADQATGQGPTDAEEKPAGVIDPSSPQVSGLNPDQRECFGFWRFGLLCRARQEEIRHAKGFNPEHDVKMARLRHEWRVLRHCERTTAGWPLPEWGGR